MRTGRRRGGNHSVRRGRRHWALILAIAPLITAAISAAVIDTLISSADSGVILGTGLEPGQGFQEIGRTDSSITYQRTTSRYALAPPAPL